ncbi:MAG TPA: YtxH domain-containing protein [Longimicrobiales bacterium]|nr:YtxH domain-containing protein [Longimicrobiales bacterium]
MSDQDDLPYVVIERRSGGAGAFLWGALLGAGVALLFAPRSGREMRDEIRAGALRMRDRAEDTVRSVTDQVSETIGGVRGEVQGRVDAARDAFEAGRRAARDTRHDMEMRVREVRAGVRGGVESVRRGSTASGAVPPVEPPPLDVDSDLGV